VDKDFKFENGSMVKVSVSGESGKVIGRAEYLTDERRYQVRYKNAMGRATEEWWTESALEAA
jgi:hypothetical protein